MENSGGVLLLFLSCVRCCFVCLLEFLLLSFKDFFCLFIVCFFPPNAACPCDYVQLELMRAFTQGTFLNLTLRVLIV